MSTKSAYQLIVIHQYYLFYLLTPFADGSGSGSLCSVEFGGHSFLVPGAYLKLIDGVAQSQSQAVHHSSSQPESVSKPIPSLPHQADSLPSYGLITHPSPVTAMQQSTPGHGPIRRKPDAPSNLRVDVVANQKLYMEWNYMSSLDYEGCSNGSKVTGFRVRSH